MQARRQLAASSLKGASAWYIHLQCAQLTCAGRVSSLIGDQAPGTGGRVFNRLHSQRSTVSVSSPQGEVAAKRVSASRASSASIASRVAVVNHLQLLPYILRSPRCQMYKSRQKAKCIVQGTARHSSKCKSNCTAFCHQGVGRQCRPRERSSTCH